MNLVIGAYDGYKSLKTNKGGLYFFIKSLRKHNNTCECVVIVHKNNIFQELVDFCMINNVIIYSEMDNLYKNNSVSMIQNTRHYAILKYIENKKYNKILLCDMNDCIFQSDPFEIESNTLYVAAEQNILSDIKNPSSRMNIDWINRFNKYFKCDNMNWIRDKPVVCVGTVYGPYKDVLDWLKFYTECSYSTVTADQGPYNVYIHYLKKIVTQDMKNSYILTLDRVNFDLLKKNEMGYIVNDNNEKYKIIHQIDRCNFEYMKSKAL